MISRLKFSPTAPVRDCSTGFRRCAGFLRISGAKNIDELMNLSTEELYNFMPQLGKHLPARMFETFERGDTKKNISVNRHGLRRVEVVVAFERRFDFETLQRGYNSRSRRRAVSTSRFG